MSLSNKVILVTGSSEGIGYAIAEYCIQQNAQIMLHGLNEKNLQHAQEKLGNQTRYICADLLQPCSYQRIIEDTIKAFGQLDGLVNNAGIYPRSNVHTSESIFDQVMTVNVKAPLCLSQYAINAFLKQQSPGSIVNIGSVNAHCGQSDLLAYSMSKGALMTMTRNLADAHTHQHIRINQINVGWTATENEIALQKSLGRPDNWQEILPKSIAPIGRILSPSDIAPHVGFWLSTLSNPCTGAVYEIEQYPIIGRNRMNEFVL